VGECSIRLRGALEMTEQVGHGRRTRPTSLVLRHRGIRRPQRVGQSVRRPKLGRQRARGGFRARQSG